MHRAHRKLAARQQVANIESVEQYLPIVLLLVVIALFAGGSVMASRMLGQDRTSGC